jgi:hypothetical protein
MRKFFGIESDKYVFEWGDVTTGLTILNVVLVLVGIAWAPIIGIVNSILGLILNIRFKTHLNMYVMQLALIVLNVYFLNL